MLAIESATPYLSDQILITGRVERGMIRVGDHVDVVGYYETQKTLVNGIEIYPNSEEEAKVGDNVGIIVKGSGLEVIRGQLICKP